MNIETEIRNIIFNICAIITLVILYAEADADVFIRVALIIFMFVFCKWIADHAQSIIDKVICYKLIKKEMSNEE